MSDKMKILYVEDEPQLRMAMADELSDLGLIVKACADGLEAFKALQSDAFDAVITDLRMPNLDGIGLRKLVTEQKSPSPPVWIALTAYSEDNPESFKKLGFDELFYKPFKPKLLVGMCQKLLHIKRASKVA